MREYKNYVFDLYGTLADIHTDEKKDELWSYMTEYFSHLGVYYGKGELKNKYSDIVNELKNNSGNEFAEIDISRVFSRFFEDKGKKIRIDDIVTAAETFRQKSLEKLKLYDGAVELLVKLRNEGKKVYLLTNAQRLFTYPELEQLDIVKYFDGIMISSDVGYKKPSYLFFWKLFSEYGLSKQDTVMIGNDDMADCHGAADFGINSIYINTEQSPVRTFQLPHNCVEIISLNDII